MKSEKELRLLSAILLFFAGGITFVSSFYTGVPFLTIIYSLIVGAAYIFIGVSLLVFKEKMRMLNIAAFAALLAHAAVQVSLVSGLFMEVSNSSEPNEVHFICLVNVVCLLAIAVILFINSLKKFNLLLTYFLMPTYFILGLAHIITYIAMIILSESYVPMGIKGVLEFVAAIFAFIGLGATLLFYKKADAKDGNEEVVIKSLSRKGLSRKDLFRAKVVEKNLHHIQVLAELYKEGAITEEEFADKKQGLLNHIE